MNSIAIKTVDLKYSYPNSKKYILKGVNLEIKRNSFEAIVGKIGGGKSTLLRLLNGILQPHDGDVLINGKSVVKNPKYPFHQEVGLLFENPDDQIFYSSVVDDIAFGPRNLKLSKEIVHQRVIGACEEVDILHLMERDTSHLSYGEKTLVALAGILAMRSNIILMDSPEFGLDLWSKPKILDLFDKLSTSYTIIASTNDIDILKKADKIHLLWNGKIQGSYGDYKSFRSALSIEN